jgi:spermidine synthase
MGGASLAGPGHPAHRVGSISDIEAKAGLKVRERGGIIEILAGSVVLLSSAALETERAFGRLVARAGAPAPRRVLIGGLGFGATVRGALEVAPEAQVVVAEKVAGVVDLVRGELGHLQARPLDDPRVQVEPADVADVMAVSTGAFDAILLDVDNGPHWASFRTNARLYTPAGLAWARRALAPGGVFAVWSGYPADRFLAQLRAAGFAPSRVLLEERGRVRARAYVGVAPP